MDFEWTEWSHWATCSATCDAGKSVRERTCQLSKNGGEKCPKDDHKDNNEYRETKPCMQKPCLSTYHDCKIELKSIIAVFFNT